MKNSSKDNKFKRSLVLIIGILLLIGLFIVLDLVIALQNIDSNLKLIIIILNSVLVLFNLIFMFYLFKKLKRKREEIAGSFDYYVEELVSVTGVGLITYSEDGEIIWASKFIDDKFENSIIGRKVTSISPDFAKNFVKGEQNFVTVLGNLIYEVFLNGTKRAIVIKDVTEKKSVEKLYEDEKVVLGELEIDNFQQLQVSISEEELFKLQSTVIRTLDELVSKHNLIYRQYVNGKFIIITNESVLKIFMDSEFSFLDEIRKHKNSDGARATVSLGMGAGTPIKKVLLELAKDALLQSQSRGGDQVAVQYANFKPKYFGATIETAATISRVKIKQVTGIIETALSKESVKNVIVYGHIWADLDAIGAAMGMVELAKAHGKQAFIQNLQYDSTTRDAIEKLMTKEQKQVFISPSKAQKITSKNSIIFIVDTAEMNRIENPKALERVDYNNVFVLDHHRMSQLPENIPASNIYIDTSASSASEIVSEVLTFSKLAIKFDKIATQMMLNGIYLDTRQFQKSISARTFEAASFLETHGADSEVSVELLKIPARASQLVYSIIREVKEIKQGFFLAAYEGEAASDVVSMVADDLLRTQGRKAVFVIAKDPVNKFYKMSARSSTINVQQIAEQLGGGGHFGSAAAVSRESFDVFKDNVTQVILSFKFNSRDEVK